nr:hypothetical protein [uncultured bacterium]
MRKFRSDQKPQEYPDTPHCKDKTDIRIRIADVILQHSRKQNRRRHVKHSVYEDKKETEAKVSICK